jgi:hypothetical protein
MEIYMNPIQVKYEANNVKPQKPHNRQTQLRKDADEMLREIAFVLEMTRRVRQEMNAEQETEELVLV